MRKLGNPLQCCTVCRVIAGQRKRTCLRISFYVIDKLVAGGFDGCFIPCGDDDFFVHDADGKFTVFHILQNR